MAAPDYALYRFWLSLGFLGCLLLFYGCLMPNPPGPHVAGFDKLEHFSAYVILGAWFGALLAPRFVPVFVGLALFGAVIEVAQYVSGYRDGDPYDWLADTLGVIAGLLLARFGPMQALRYIDSRVAAKRHRPR